MEVEKIQLPDFVLAELYKDCIVELEEKPVEEVSEFVQDQEINQPTGATKPPIKFLGENNKNVVVLINEPKAIIIKEDELEFLSKILLACKLNLADIAIVNFDKQSVSFSELKDQFKATHLLLLGVEPMSINLPFSIPQFQVQPFADTTIIYAPDLSGMLVNNEESKLLKSKLWVSLKTAFKL